MKIKKFQNGGRNGDPIPSDSTGVATSQVQPVLTDSAGVGYIRNEGGNLVPIGFSEFHEEPEIDMNALKRGVAAVESGGGQEIFMKNPVTSATGTYQQLFREIKDMDIMKGKDRDDFAKDTRSRLVDLIRSEADLTRFRTGFDPNVFRNTGLDPNSGNNNNEEDSGREEEGDV